MMYKPQVSNPTGWWNILLYFLSPLALLLVVVCIIAFLDRVGQHNRLVNLMSTRGAIVEATVSRLDPEKGLVFLDYRLDGEERIGLLYTRYYPDALDVLAPGNQILARVDRSGVEALAVWEDRFSQFRGYLGFATDLAVIFAAGWLVLVLRPEILYVGLSGPETTAPGESSK